MPITLNEAEQKQLAKIEQGNRLLFFLGIGGTILVIGVSSLVAVNPNQVADLLSSTWPSMDPILKRLDQIVPQTALEQDLLARLREIIPLGPIMVKVMAVGSALAWVFCTGILVMGLAVQQGRMIRFFKSVISKK